jgi:hypothetical protein
MMNMSPRRNDPGAVEMEEVRDGRELGRGTFQVDLPQALAAENGSEIKWESFRIESVSIEQTRVLYTSYMSRPSR